MDLRKLFIGSIALIIMLSLGCSGGGANDIGVVGDAAETMWAVSYTHLTLPTILLV